MSLWWAFTPSGSWVTFYSKTPASHWMSLSELLALLNLSSLGRMPPFPPRPPRVASRTFPDIVCKDMYFGKASFGHGHSGPLTGSPYMASLNWVSLWTRNSHGLYVVALFLHSFYNELNWSSGQLGNLVKSEAGVPPGPSEARVVFAVLSLCPVISNSTVINISPWWRVL